MKRVKFNCDVCHADLTPGESDFIAFEFAQEVPHRFRHSRTRYYDMERHICVQCLAAMAVMHREAAHTEGTPESEGQDGNQS